MMTDREIINMLRDLRAHRNLDGLILVGDEWAAMLAHIEKLEEALQRIQQWAQAYPVKAFPPVSIEDLRHAQFACKAIGIELAAIHGEWARHILKGIEEITNRALADQEDET